MTTSVFMAHSLILSATKRVERQGAESQDLRCEESGEDFFYNIAMHIGQPKAPALVQKGQLRVIDP
jgi:hypothetical protein